MNSYTYSTRISPTQEFKDYFSYYGNVYGKALRTAFRNIKTSKEHELRKEISVKFGLNTRMASSVVKDAKGIYNSQLALSKHNHKEMQGKVQKQVAKIEKATKQLQVASSKKVIRNRLYLLRLRLNRLRQKLNNLENRIKNKHVSLCFGSKELFKRQYTGYYKTRTKWLNEWRKARSRYFKFVGEKAKKFGNELCQYNNQQLKIRVPDGYGKYIYQDCKFHIDLEPYFNNSPLTYQFIKRGHKYYVYVVVSLEKEALTRRDNGTIGLDYNEGFITLCETDKQGNIIGFNEYILNYHGAGNHAKTEIEQTIHKIVKYAETVGKDIVYENLDFRQLKRKVLGSKRRNRALHQFDYSRYKSTLENIAYRNGVGYIEVKSAYTSHVGDILYSKAKGISRHMSASFVIARMGQGYNDVTRYFNHK